MNSLVSFMNLRWYNIKKYIRYLFIKHYLLHRNQLGILG